MVDKALPWVLVVDDNEANRYAVGRTLRSAGFEISEASSGRQAIEQARRGPDAIVLDVNLPDINGFDVVRSLRDDPTTAAIPVLHLSASYMRNEDRAHGLENGANAYLTHPIEPAVFVATVRSLLRVRQLERARETSAAEWSATFDAISDPVCVVDERGIVTRANRSAIRVLGAGHAVEDRNWTALLASAYRGLTVAAVVDALARREARVLECEAADAWLRIALDPLPQFTRFAGSTVCVVTDVTSSKRAELERAALLESANAARTQAEQANRAKSEFLATMSHELRTPINAILGYTQILDMGIAGRLTDEQREHLDRLRRSATHLLTLVNELLDLATVESGTMRVDRRVAVIDEVIEDALAITRPQALARGITLVAEDTVHRHQSFVGDTGRTRQILLNLLANAVKFSEPGARITLGVECGDGPADASLRDDRAHVGVNIRDTGIGVSAEQFAAIFEPFVQGESGPTRPWGGSGLGLATSRRLARLMGGDITVRSELGQGSVFTLWLPAAANAAPGTTGQHATRRRSAPFDPKIFSQLGRIISLEGMAIGHQVALRIRTDDRFAPSGALTDPQLVDHIPAYVVDLGLALAAIGEIGTEASETLHDGSVIRTAVAERHGAQRKRLGWNEGDLRMEYDILHGEIERTLRARAGSDEAHLEAALEVIARLIDQGVAISQRGWREAP